MRTHLEAMTPGNHCEETAEMPITNDTARRVSVGALNRRQLAALVAVLAPYHAEPVSAPVLELATRLARLTTLDNSEATQ